MPRIRGHTAVQAVSRGEARPRTKRRNPCKLVPPEGNRLRRCHGQQRKCALHPPRKLGSGGDYRSGRVLCPAQPRDEPEQQVHGGTAIKGGDDIVRHDAESCGQ